MSGIRMGKSAFGRTIRTIKGNNAPIAVRAAWEKIDNGIVLSKAAGSTDGFMFKLTRIDSVESLFNKLSPILLAACVVFSLLSSFLNGQPRSVLRCFAAISCGMSAFTLLWPFNLPFDMVSKKLAAKGSAIAGWEGSVSVTNSVALLVKDQDLFSAEGVYINSFKISPWIEARDAILYAGSMAVKSNAGFCGAFEDLLKQYKLMPQRVSDFDVLDSGGIRGRINDHKISFGSEAFMHISNIHLSGFNSNILGAAFLAVDERAAAVFTLQYLPTEKVQRSLYRLTNVKSKVKPLFATRDFNLTPAMLRSKFKIDLKDIEPIPYAERFKLSEDNPDKKAKPIAVLTDNGLNSFADISDSGRQLNSRVKYSKLFSVLCAFLGLFLMFFSCGGGGFETASPLNALIFHSLFAVLVLITNLADRQ
jgi:hypothetical protein